MKTRTVLSSAARIDDDNASLVERPAPGKAPTAFRIWAAGNNVTDDGPMLFSARSAKLVMQEQATRGNLYSLDYDHLSLKVDRPATAGQAAGWHKLEVRNGELWATSVEWVTEAKAGLEATPPKWRYFSPAYLQDVETGEVVSYCNTALCINPKTHSNTQLATRAVKASTMDQSEMLAALKAILDSDADEDTKAKAQALYDVIAAAVGGDAKAEEMVAARAAKMAAEAAPAEEPAPESKKEPVAAAKTASKAISKADSASADVALRLAALEAKVENDAVSRLVEANVGVKIPESLKSWAAVQKLDTLTAFLASAPLIAGAPAVKAVIATRGSDVDAPVAADPLAKHIDAVLGTRSVGTKRGMDSKAVDGVVTINIMTPTEARRLAAVK
jgi:hypothetical protein